MVHWMSYILLILALFREMLTQIAMLTALFQPFSWLSKGKKGRKIILPVSTVPLLLLKSKKYRQAMCLRPIMLVNGIVCTRTKNTKRDFVNCQNAN